MEAEVSSLREVGGEPDGARQRHRQQYNTGHEARPDPRRRMLFAHGYGPPGTQVLIWGDMAAHRRLWWFSLCRLSLEGGTSALSKRKDSQAISGGAKFERAQVASASLPV